MIDVGIDAKSVEKFQVEDSSIDDYSVCFPKDHLRVLIKLHFVLSYFPSTKRSI